MPNPLVRRRRVIRRRSSSSSGILLPNQIPNLMGWWDASTLALSNGASCATLLNLQGTSGRDFTSSGVNQPTFRTAIKNGLGVLEFDGSNDYMQAGGTPATYLKSDGTAGTLIAVCCPTSLTLNNASPYGNHPVIAGNSDYFGVYAKNSSPATIVGYTWLSSARTVSADFAGANAWLVIAFRLINGATIKVSINGGAESSATSDGINVGSGLSGQFRIGAGGSQFFSGYIGEAAAYNVAISDLECAYLIAGLKAKWGIS